MQAVVYIDKDIKAGSLDCSVDTVKERIAKYQALYEVDGIRVVINCNGGSPIEAFKIVECLEGYGLPIETHVDGVCYSAATIIQLAAKPEARFATELSKFKYHPVHYPVLMDMDKDALQERLEHIAQVEAIMVEFYAERIPMGTEEALMLYVSDVNISAEEAKALGIVSKIKAVKQVKPLPEVELEDLAAFVSEDKNKSKINMNVKDKLKVLLGLGEPANLKAMELALADGTKITTNGVDVGNEVFVGEDLAPDGEHTLEDGRKIITEGGKIMEVIEAVGGGGSELEDLKAENAKLKAMCTELEDKMKGYAEMSNKVKEYDEIVPASVAKIEELQNKVAEKNKQIDELQARIVEKSVPAGTSGGAVAKTWQPTPQWELRKQALTNNKQF